MDQERGQSGGPGLDASPLDDNPADACAESQSEEDDSRGAEEDPAAASDAGGAVVVAPKEEPVDPTPPSSPSSSSVSGPTPEKRPMKEEAAAQRAAAGDSHSSSATASSSGRQQEPETTYHVKYVAYQNRKCAVVLQNKNGPCPVMAIANVLLLRGKIHLGEGAATVEAQELRQLVESAVDAVSLGDFAGADPSADEGNLAQNKEDARDALEGLFKGLNVNIRFDRVDSYEFTKNVAIFDVFRAHLVHGWLYDAAAEPELAATIGSMSFNEVGVWQVENLGKPEMEWKCALVQQFMECTQLTNHGVARLNEHVREGVLYVFFRNDHFSVLTKDRGQLYTLVNNLDFGQYQRNIAWEKLTVRSITGDSEFADEAFRPVALASPAASVPADADHGLTKEQQEEHDRQIALSLQQQDQDSGTNTTANTTCGSSGGGEARLADVSQCSADEELARRMQEEADAEMAEQAQLAENQDYQLQQQQQQQQQQQAQQQQPRRGGQQQPPAHPVPVQEGGNGGGGGGGRGRGRDCTIL